MNTKGMPSPALSEEDVRRIAREEFMRLASQLCDKEGKEATPVSESYEDEVDHRGETD